jgi:hypothetical protein
VHVYHILAYRHSFKWGAFNKHSELFYRLLKPQIYGWVLLGTKIKGYIRMDTVYHNLINWAKQLQGTATDHPASLPSLATHVASLSLLHPLFHLLWLGKTRDKLESYFTPVTHDLGCDIHVVMLHTFSPQSNSAAGLVVQRQETDPCFPLEQFPLSNGLVSLQSLSIGYIFLSILCTS